MSKHSDSRATYEDVNLSLIDTADFNPPSRTTSGALRNLSKSIDALDLETPLHVIRRKNGRFLLVDGHRRFTVYASSGTSQLNVRVYNMPEEMAGKLWSILNSGTRAISSLEWMDAWHRNDRIEVPPAIMGNIKKAMTIFGGRIGIQFLLDNRVDAGIVTQINMLHNAIMSKPSLGVPPSLRVIGMWMIRHKCRGLIAQLIKRGQTDFKLLRKILSRIEGDKKFTIEDLVSK